MHKLINSRSLSISGTNMLNAIKKIIKIIKKLPWYSKKFYSKIRFHASSNNWYIFGAYYRYFYKPEPGSLSEFIDHFSRLKNGDVFVVQVGANDGINRDPIHKFIKRDNWKGVLLEPQKFVFDNFLNKIYKKDLGITTINAALGEKDGTLPIYKIGFSNSRWATGLTSFDKKVLEQAFERGYVKEQAAKEKLIIPENLEKWIIEEKVTVISPESLIENYNIGRIDLLVIDAEGYDFEIIKIFNGIAIKPQVIIFEAKHLTNEDKIESIKFLKKLKYTITIFGRNIVACTS